MTQTISETDIIEKLDWDSPIPCMYTMHPAVGDGPAVWKVKMRAPQCGCAPPQTRFFCDPCWKKRQSYIFVYCPAMCHIEPTDLAIISVEPIK